MSKFTLSTALAHAITALRLINEDASRPADPVRQKMVERMSKKALLDLAPANIFLPKNNEMDFNGIDFARFTNVEVSAVVGVDGDGRELGPNEASKFDQHGLQVTNDHNNQNILHWSVYGRYDPEHPANDEFRGVNCLADVFSKDIAVLLGEAITGKIDAAREQASDRIAPR